MFQSYHQGNGVVEIQEDKNNRNLVCFCSKFQIPNSNNLGLKRHDMTKETSKSLIVVGGFGSGS